MTCACLVIPSFKILRRHWWIIVVVCMVGMSVIGVEMRRQDVSTTMIIMNNGRSIPVLGLGTWQSGRKTKRAVRVALDEVRKTCCLLCLILLNPFD